MPPTNRTRAKTAPHAMTASSNLSYQFSRIRQFMLSLRFVGSNYLTQGELYRLSLPTAGFCLLAFLVLGTPWLLFVAR